MAQRREGARDAVRVEDAGGEVAAAGAPERAVGRGADGALGGCEDDEGRDGGRAAGEGGPALDERAVGDVPAGDEDGRARGEEAEGEDGPVAAVQVADRRLEAGARAPEPEERADDRDGGRQRQAAGRAGSSRPGWLQGREKEEGE